MISMEEKNTYGKRKTVPLIPANYISILQLQERWLNEKEKKRKEEEERRRKLQAEEEKKIEEEDLKKAEEEKRMNRSNRKHFGRKKESIDGGEARFVEKEKPEVTVAIESGGGEDAADGLPKKKKKKKKNKGAWRKRYNSKTNKNQDGAVVEDVIDCGCVSSIVPPESVVTENNTPVKDVVPVYWMKATKSKEITKSMAIETQFENFSINRGEAKTLKTQTKWRYRNRPMPRGASSSTMVWVKKEQNERAGYGIASGVKPFNA
ncbi:hypothetical protein AtNW77_Chr2g0250881 [Arabidopsis thaliana]|uniref:Uncharacterized protein n=2 Tax=Arabidopsis TaxID=3701 RepID=A0A178VU01_ARATH|nr:hypothetical protein ISN45_At02g025160 [Arabidopsis thaliana x Arabidopsis arenosa]OAP09897.1 hypothetical protein AXX17_AT2G27110 [Arabidopsis thaliana]